jgi:hypothetical protein
MSGVPYQAGGPLPASSSVYAPRDADVKAITHLRRMEYITLVEPRQHGKTSLINRLIGQFSSQRYVFAYRDLMAAKSSADSLANWYTSLGRWLLRQLRFIPRGQQPEPPIDSASWEDFLAAIAENAEDAEQNIVIVLDEIGAMPAEWATDFFSVIRSVYTSRGSLPFWKRLTFIIAGAFNPKELIQDDTVSNFNVDQRIPLNDFDLSQVKQLVAHLGLPGDLTEVVAERVHYWTDGQPYLSQCLCLYLAEQKGSITVAAVDDAVERFFHEDTHHLSRIKDLASEPDLLAYTQRITGEPPTRFSAALNDRHFRLAHIIGVIKASPDRMCQIRNRIYERALAEVEEQLRDQFLEEQREGEQKMTELSPEVKAQGISFLFDIGRWAASELKERWRFARQNKGAEQTAEVDFSQPKEDVEQQAETLLQDAATDFGATEVGRVLELIERKHGLILEWKEMKVDNEEEHNRGLLPRAALRIRQQELDEKIAGTMAEIETDLRDLGVQVEKEETE